MYDASLHDHLWEDCSCTVFQTRHAVHGEMVGIAEMVLHLPFERRLEDGREDAFDDILDFLCVLGLVGFHDLLGDIVCGSGNHFAFCHVGINPPMGCPERARTVSTNLAFTQTIIHSRLLQEPKETAFREKGRFSRKAVFVV